MSVFPSVSFSVQLFPVVAEWSAEGLFECDDDEPDPQDSVSNKQAANEQELRLNATSIMAINPLRKSCYSLIDVSDRCLSFGFYRWKLNINYFNCLYRDKQANSR